MQQIQQACFDVLVTDSHPAAVRTIEESKIRNRDDPDYTFVYTAKHWH